VSGQVPAPLHFRMGCNRDDVSGSAKSSKPNLRHGDNARLPAGLLRPDGGAALTAGKQVFVVCPYEWTLAAHARWRAAKRPNGTKSCSRPVRGASRGRRDEVTADGGALRLLMDTRHEEAIGHALLEMPDHRGLGARY